MSLRTFQKTEVFGPLAVIEGVLAGALARGDSDPEARAREALRSVGLEAKVHLRAEQLSYGDQRLLEIAQALAAKPQVLLLDEPASGMNRQESGTSCGSSPSCAPGASPSCSSSTTCTW